jgi:diketogulonate reductase-like aldo/keto reductase
MEQNVPQIRLQSGHDMPALGFGTWQIYQPAKFAEAYNIGYRHFDSATMYGNLDGLS